MQWSPIVHFCTLICLLIKSCDLVFFYFILLLGIQYNIDHIKSIIKDGYCKTNWTGKCLESFEVLHCSVINVLKAPKISLYRTLTVLNCQKYVKKSFRLYCYFFILLFYCLHILLYHYVFRFYLCQGSLFLYIFCFVVILYIYFFSLINDDCLLLLSH